MGTILGSKTTKDGRIVYEIEVDYEESLQLKGHIKNVRVFSEEASEVITTLSTRGKNDSTKYFLVPRDLRQNLKFSDTVKCQKLETDSKILFIYIVDKLRI